MQVGQVVRPLLQQVRAQDVAEQVVVAVPLPTVVERYDEQVGALQRLEHGPAAAPAGHGVAERAAEPLEDRGVEQEPAYVVGLAGEDLLDEVVDDVAVVAREAGDEAGDVVAALERQRRQLQGGDPALRASPQGREVVRPQIQRHDVVQVGRHLGRREAEVGRADLDELAARP